MNRFWLGFASLCLSLLLWLDFGQKEPTIQRELRVPLETRNLPPGLVPIDLPGRVSVIAEGPRNQLDRLATDAVLATVDLSRARTGGGTFPLTVATPGGLRIKLDTRWPTLRLNLAQTVVLTRPVVIETLGTPPEGMEYSGAEAEPSSVTLTIPSTERGNVKDVRAVLDLNRLSSGLGYIEAELVVVNSKNEPIPAASVEPARVRIRPLLGKEGEARTVFVNPQWQGALPFGFVVGDVTVSPQQVRLAGNIEPATIFTKPISLKGRTQTFTEQVELELPEGSRLTSPTTITVTVIVLPDPKAAGR
ncbi:MAG: hypothetical protein JNJ45_08110 [Chthonomonas sp.]|nr:hypothetical protein [Chthonomonas sp.]